MEKTEKMVEEPKTEKKSLTGNKMLDLIIAKTYSRHNDLSESEFLEAIGFKDSGKTEEEAVRIAMMNVIVAMTKVLIECKGTLNITNGFLKSMLNEDVSVKDEKEGE